MKERLYNPVTEEMLEKAKYQREAYYLQEYFNLSVRMPRDKSEELKRFFGERGTTMEKAVSRYLEVCLETGEIPY